MSSTLPVIVRETEPGDTSDAKGRLFGGATTALLAVKPIAVDRLKASLEEMTGSLSEALTPTTTRGPAGLHLKEITVHLEVTAEGGVNLIGAAGTVGATAGLTLTFVRAGE